MPIVKHNGGFQWDRVEILKYKEADGRFKDITRQVLFAGRQELPAQLRYFEIAAGGHSTLERHVHVHLVMIIRGSGEALLGETIQRLGAFDLVEIPPLTWHQFRATAGEPFGFLCLVTPERDRPEHPRAEQLNEMKTNPRVAEFIRV